MSAALLYDADCGFCRTCVGVLLTWDRARRLRPVAIQSAEGGRLLADLPEERRLDSWHLVTKTPGSERRRSAGAAFPELLRGLRGGAPFAALAERFPSATERGYRWVADHRVPLGRLAPGGARRWADRRIADRGQAGPGASR